jgi:hypothetical protein
MKITILHTLCPTTCTFNYHQIRKIGTYENTMEEARS